MSPAGEFIVRAVLIGAGATLVIDLWAVLLRQVGVSSLQMTLLGRWIGHLPDGRWVHANVAAAAPVRGERWIGWGAHYAIGITLAALLLRVEGLDWARTPSLFPALRFGVVTVAGPWFVLQPAMGAGLASTRTPRPVFNAAKSLLTHATFGLGLYLAACLSALIPAA